MNRLTLPEPIRPRRAFRVDPVTRLPIIARREFEGIAHGFLEEYFPLALRDPRPVPILQIAAAKLGLELVEDYALSEDGSVQGMIAFGDGVVDIYDPREQEFRPLPVRRGTVLCDPAAAGMRFSGPRRMTVCHECLHWILHRGMKVDTGAPAVALRCTNLENELPRPPRTQGDWMEWQANGIAPLILMPAEMFTLRAQEISREAGSLARSDPRWPHQLASQLAVEFDVSATAAEIRLHDLDLLAHEAVGKAI